MKYIFAFFTALFVGLAIQESKAFPRGRGSSRRVPANRGQGTRFGGQGTGSGGQGTGSGGQGTGSGGQGTGSVGQGTRSGGQGRSRGQGTGFGGQGTGFGGQGTGFGGQGTGSGGQRRSRRDRRPHGRMCGLLDTSTDPATSIFSYEAICPPHTECVDRDPPSDRLASENLNFRVCKPKTCSVTNDCPFPTTCDDSPARDGTRICRVKPALCVALRDHFGDRSLPFNLCMMSDSDGSEAFSMIHY